MCSEDEKEQVRREAAAAAEARLAEAERLLRALYNASATGPSPARTDARAFLDRQEEPKP